MSDIVERLRAWVYTDSLYTTAREAADEIERLRQVVAQENMTDAEREAYRTFDDWYSEIEGYSLRLERLHGPAGELRAAFLAGQSGMRLTDAEREAVANAINIMSEAGWGTSRLRSLLARQNPPATDRQ